MENAREKGLKLFREVFGDAMADGVVAHGKSSEAFGPEQSNWSLDFPFGTVWPREGLERKLRSCVVLGLLIAQGQHDEIKFHTRMGMKTGLSRKELEEIFYTAIPYAGFPAANSGKRAMLEAFAEMEAEG
jgi:alkylhydroperoxidase/carboxymuconolactone decarboxylase family protein YurZ